MCVLELSDVSILGFFLSDIIKKRNPSKKGRNLHETVFVARAGRQWTKNRFCVALSLKFSITQGTNFNLA